MEITLSRSTMGHVLKQIYLVRKKKTLHATEKDTPRVQQAWVDYWGKIRDTALNPLTRKPVQKAF